MSRSWHFIRLTIEAQSPLSIGGGEDITLDVPDSKTRGNVTVTTMGLLRDANNLPTIPGGSSQGVLRRWYRVVHGEKAAGQLFGYENPDGNGNAARFSVSWGAVHDSNDDAMIGIVEVQGTNDPFLNRLLENAPHFQDHVALSMRHSVDGRKKFSRVAVPIGTRFSLELSAWGEDETGEALKEVAALFALPEFRIGGGTTHGYGKIHLIRASYQAFGPAKTIAMRNCRLKRPSDILAQDILGNLKSEKTAATQAVLELTFPHNIRVGAMTPAENTPEDDIYKTLWTHRSIRFDWENKSEQPLFPLPGSSLKGPLAHRALYHLNRLTGQTIDVEAYLQNEPNEQERELEALGQRPEALEKLLGSAREGKGRQAKGRAAGLMVDDAEFSGDDGAVPETARIQRNSIDRFTGGTRMSVLYEEEILVAPKARVVLTFLPSKGIENTGPAAYGKTAARALLFAMRDLCQGRLAIGARSLGIAQGQVRWSGARESEWRALSKKLEVPLAQEAGDE